MVASSLKQTTSANKSPASRDDSNKEGRVGNVDNNISIRLCGTSITYYFEFYFVLTIAFVKILYCGVFFTVDCVIERVLSFGALKLL